MTFAYPYTVSPIKGCVLLLLCFTIQLWPWQSCHGEERTEAIKTAYLYNFAKFTRWADFPETADLHIQIIGIHPFGKSLSPVTSKSIGKHHIKISTPQDYNPEKSPQILFISQSHEPSLQHILRSVADKQVLTVSDIPHFTDNGGMIELIEKGNNIRFRINLDAARKSGIELNSQMLSLADSVINNSTGAK